MIPEKYPDDLLEDYHFYTKKQWHGIRTGTGMGAWAIFEKNYNMTWPVWDRNDMGTEP